MTTFVKKYKKNILSQLNARLSAWNLMRYVIVNSMATVIYRRVVKSFEHVENITMHIVLMIHELLKTCFFSAVVKWMYGQSPSLKSLRYTHTHTHTYIYSGSSLSRYRHKYFSPVYTHNPGQTQSFGGCFNLLVTGKHIGMWLKIWIR